jgi:hypothetical protein
MVTELRALTAARCDIAERTDREMRLIRCLTQGAERCRPGTLAKIRERPPWRCRAGACLQCTSLALPGKALRPVVRTATV